MKVLSRPAFPTYVVAGRFLYIEVSDERLSRIVGDLFGGWSLKPVASDTQDAEATIRFLLEPDPPSIPQGWAKFEIADGGCCYTDGDSYYVEFANSLILVHPAKSKSVTVWLRKLSQLPNTELAHCVSFAVCSALRRCNLFELHAAAVVPSDSESASLFIGPSGSGKSTLALNLIQSGWNYLSDDELLLEKVGGAVQARGFRRFFAVSKSPHVATVSVALGGTKRETDVKTCFEPSTIFPVREIDASIPDRLLFLRITGEKTTRLIELTTLESMSRLIRACPWATYDHAVAHSHLSLLSQLARQTISFEFRAGTDVLHPRAASDLLLAEFSRHQ